MPRSPRPGGLARLACHGQCRPEPARRAHHDQLLRVETDPDAVVELLELAVTWTELEYPEAEMIAPARWLDFAQRHRWQDPERALRIFSLAVDVALRAAPGAGVSGPAELGMAAGSGICPALVPPVARAPRLTVAGR